MPKEILFLAYFFPPYCNTPSIRALEITKRLKEYDYKIFVVSVKNSTYSPKDEKLLKEIDSPFIIKNQLYYTTIPFNALEFVLRKINHKFDFIKPSFFFHWIPLNFFKCNKIIRKNNIKLIYTTGPPHYSLFLGYLLKKFYKIPLIIEYRDPWIYNPYHKEKSQLYNKKFEKIEKKILNSADAIITVSDALKEFLINHFPSEAKKDKMYVLPSGLNINKFSEFNLKKTSNKEIIFTFTGMLYSLRDLKPLIQIVSEVEKLGKLKNISLKINIFGKYDFQYLSNLIKKYKVSNYFYLKGYISRDECFRQIQKSTLPLHVGENLNFPTISFKVWEYLSMRKKTLYLGREDSYTANFLEDNNLGYVIPLNNLKLGIKKFIDLIEGITSNQIKTEIKLDQILNFTWDKMVKDLMEIFDKFV